MNKYHFKQIRCNVRINCCSDLKQGLRTAENLLTKSTFLSIGMSCYSARFPKRYLTIYIMLNFKHLTHSTSHIAQLLHIHTSNPRVNIPTNTYVQSDLCSAKRSQWGMSARFTRQPRVHMTMLAGSSASCSGKQSGIRIRKREMCFT